MVPAEKSISSSRWIIEKLINGPCSSLWIWSQPWLFWSSRLCHTKSSRLCQCWRSQWATLDLQCLDPLKWGWECKGQLLQPVETDVDVAPKFLLKVIRCQYKVTAKDPCASNWCSCRKSGISCVTACTNCRGTECATQTLQQTTHLQVEKMLMMETFLIFLVNQLFDWT